MIIPSENPPKLVFVVVNSQIVMKNGNSTINGTWWCYINIHVLVLGNKMEDSRLENLRNLI